MEEDNVEIEEEEVARRKVKQKGKQKALEKLSKGGVLVVYKKWKKEKVGKVSKKDMRKL